MRYSERANVQNVPPCVKCYRLFLCVEMKTLKRISAAFCAVFSVSAAGVCVCVCNCVQTLLVIQHVCNSMLCRDRVSECVLLSAPRSPSDCIQSKQLMSPECELLYVPDDFLCQIASEHRVHRLLQMRNIYSWTLLHFDVLSSAGRRQLFSYSCKKSPLYSRQSFHSCFWQEMILHSIHPRPLALPFHSWESLVFLSVYVCVFCNMTATKYPKDLLQGCCTYKKKKKGLEHIEKKFIMAPLRSNALPWK